MIIFIYRDVIDYTDHERSPGARRAVVDGGEKPQLYPAINSFLAAN